MYNQSRVATLLSASGIRSEDLIRAWTSMSTIEELTGINNNKYPGWKQKMTGAQKRLLLIPPLGRQA